MILTNFRLLIRAMVPGAKKTVVSDTLLDILINKGVNDVNSFGKVYKGNVKFDVKTASGEYDILTEVVANFSLMDQSGIWWNAGTTAIPQWRQLFPKTKKWLDVYQPDWRNQSASEPRYYYSEPERIVFSPKADTALTDGFWLYYIKAAKDMANGDHFPFTGTTSEITSLRDLDDAIIDYVRWKLQRPLGREQQGILTKQEYEIVRREKIMLVERKPDISASGSQLRSGQAKMQIPNIR